MKRATTSIRYFSVASAIAAFLTSSSPAGAATVDDFNPSCSPQGIVTACQRGGGSFAAFPGKYAMALTIGSRTFQDRLTISYITRHPGMANLAEVIAGEFSSPEANLYSPLINGKIASGLDFRTFNAVNLSFGIRVTEHGKKFSVFFTGRSESGTACSIVGTAFADFEKTKVFGTFVMTKDTPDCDCSAK